MSDAPPSAPVAVIGGGIAGAAATISLAQSGLRPLWLAAPDDPQRIAVGESLSPAARPMLQSLGLGKILGCPPHRPSNTIFMSWGGRLTERSASVHLEGSGWVLDRRHFEHDLGAEAATRAELVRTVVQRAEPNLKGWRLLLQGGEERSAAFMIDATGRAARFARGLATRRRIDRQVAVTAMLEQESDAVQPTPATLIEAVAAGWWYAALLPSGRLSLAFFTDPDLLPRSLSRDAGAFRAIWEKTHYVRRWIGEAGFVLSSPPHLASAATLRMDTAAGVISAGSAWAAAGDAAAGFDPLSSHGMTTALWTGIHAGRAAARWLAGDREPLMAYARAVQGGFDDFLSQRTAIYACEARYADAPFWKRRMRG